VKGARSSFNLFARAARLWSRPASVDAPGIACYLQWQKNLPIR